MAMESTSGPNASLILEDGEVFPEGRSFGATKSLAGEVVFNTGMVGYVEAITDPSYAGQILVLTVPMVGNYGVPPSTCDSLGIPHFMESHGIHIAGLVVADYSKTYSHWNAVKSLGQWLAEAGVPAIYGVDTRAITKRLREKGSILGKIQIHGDNPIPFYNPNTANLVAQVSRKTSQHYCLPDNTAGTGAPHILAFDCGMKMNILRHLLYVRKCNVTVVPYDYDLEHNPEEIAYDGIFLSNGPGDPTMCHETIASIKWAIQQKVVPPVPIFGICLGNQLLALACGAKTYKMKYGNRGMNQPCIDLRTTKCYITAQNHGYAVDHDTLPEQWKPLFLNANDLSNEGITHVSKPFFSAQFHPEACGGPRDTEFLFGDFVDMVKGKAPEKVLVDPALYETTTVKKVLLIGSGGLSIGQAGEFDYSGSQAIKALKEEGVEVVLINPNIATVQTSKDKDRASADTIYFLPIRFSVVRDIIEKERPDGVIVSMGGQTALNIGIELFNAGVFDKYNCKVLGTTIPTIIATEDRNIFSQRLQRINESLALSYPATTMDEACKVSLKIGYPVLVRAAYALGGLGSGFAEMESQLREQCAKAFAMSNQVLIDQDLRGWKEVEYEVVRDCRDNCITVCNMENFDPLGVHTGDSIVIAPSQTLSNSEYMKLRDTSIKVIRDLGIVGECNIQYALNPYSEEYCIIEVNARLSRSSALASKATGYPLAYVATKLCLGKDLVSIRNSINQVTTACFEPSLDYCVVKIPRWDLAKFNKVSSTLGSSMTSVGEVMAIGRTFEEAIQKGVRMVCGGNLDGLDGNVAAGVDLEYLLRVPTDKRLWAVQAALEQGYSVEEVSRISHIDRWFLARLARIASLKANAMLATSLESLDKPVMLEMKQAGFSDRQIATYVDSSEMIVRRRRLQYGIIPFSKQIDTLAAEFPALTNYLYMTYNATSHDTMPPSPPQTHQQRQDNVMVLGCGAYCIGSSVEFDWCAVSAVRQARSLGYRALVANYNPETVSTDYDESDGLYFEELTLERVLDIYELERSMGIVVSVGGQIPNNLALPLHHQGVRVLGTSPASIDRAEDRHKFSALLDELQVDQPKWSELRSVDEAKTFAGEVGYPVIVRPSFVLSGAAMSMASTEEELINCLSNAVDVSADKPVVISKYIINAKEIEFDGVASSGQILNYAISEHVENAGVHSGDATLVLPAQKLYVQTVRAIKHIASRVATSLNITGPFNMQLLAKDNMVKVIECNLRASRTFPFVSKTFGCNFISLATTAMLGHPLKPFNISLYDYDYVAVKAPTFSFTRLRGADPTLGVEMSSTGEVACFGRDLHEAFLQSLLATTFQLPDKEAGKHILVSIAEDDMRHEFMDAMVKLQEMGYPLAGTPGTAEFYSSRGVTVKALEKPRAYLVTDDDCDSSGTGDDKGKEQPHGEMSALKWIRSKMVDLVINIPEGSTRRDEITAGYLMRRAAVDFGCGLITNMKCSLIFVDALHRNLTLPVKSAEEYVEKTQAGYYAPSQQPTTATSND
jgi:carbamoyl-phosphate synthase/aspartate carbamoyltransferase